MTHPNNPLQRCVEAVLKRTDFIPEIALVLGSGLGDFADRMTATETILYSDLPDFPVSTVPGHAGAFILGLVEGVPTICMQGRVHLYEGYSPSEVVLPIQLMHALGAKVLFLTNASGGICKDFLPGDLMLITDHISSFVPNPLVGGMGGERGPLFIDMTTVYDAKLQQTIISTAAEHQIPLKRGVYVQLSGPSYETPAEIRMLRTLGADAVGMSTVVEAIMARRLGMRVCGISCISNPAAGLSQNPLSHEEVQEAARGAAPLFRKLVQESIKRF